MAIATHGPLRGCALAAWRLLRCHPFARGGLDPVPPPRDARSPGHRTRTVSPRTITIGRAAARRLPFRTDRKYPLPEIHNPNLQSQGSGGGGGGGDMRSTMAFMLLVLVAFLGYQYFFASPSRHSSRPPRQTQSQTGSAGSPGRAQIGAAAAAGRGRAAACAPRRRSPPRSRPRPRSRTSCTRSSSPIAARRSSTGF